MEWSGGGGSWGPLSDRRVGNYQRVTCERPRAHGKNGRVKEGAWKVPECRQCGSEETAREGSDKGAVKSREKGRQRRSRKKKHRSHLCDICYLLPLLIPSS